MKRKIVMIIMVMIITALCVGCGNGVKTEKELLIDLTAASSFYMAEGSEVSELSIIKRLTDQDNKTDKVYVSITIDHEAATATQAYIMNYTCYNEGWLLDNIEGYYGDEIEWRTVPKAPPTNEIIMEELIARSNYQIDTSYQDQFTSKELKHIYFFEEGKYSTEIYSGDMLLEELVYTCIVKTDRAFENMNVSETQLLRFMFDEYTFEWYLYDDEIIWIHGDSYIDGLWYVPTNGANIQFEMTSGSYGPNAFAEYNMICTTGNKKLEESFKLPFPTTQSIDPSWCSIGEVTWGPVHMYIEVSPDMVWCYDSFCEYSFELEPIELYDNPLELEMTGIVDMSIKENAEPYREVTRDVLNAIFIEPDFIYVEEMWHPAFTECLSVVEELILSGEYQSVSMTHVYTLAACKDEKNEEAEEYFLYLEDNGCSADEIIMSSFYLETVNEGGVEYHDIGVILAKEDGKIYVVEIG